MRKYVSQVFLLMFLVITVSACTVKVTPASNKKSVPPGQMKKATGSQSAKPYAPGQQKKKH